MDLGIENLPKITQIEFNFKHHSHPTPGGFRDPSKDKDLAESELYKTKMLAKTVGKTFTMKFNQFWIEDQNKLSFSGDNYVFGSFAEVKEEKTPNDDQNSPPDKNSPDNTPPPNSPKNDSNQNSTSHSKT